MRASYAPSVASVECANRGPREVRHADTALITTHGAVEDEVRAAYLDGFGAGLAEANRRMTEALEAAIAGSHGYDLTGRRETARQIVRRLAGLSGRGER